MVGEVFPDLRNQRQETILVVHHHDVLQRQVGKGGHTSHQAFERHQRGGVIVFEGHLGQSLARFVFVLLVGPDIVRQHLVAHHVHIELQVGLVDASVQPLEHVLLFGCQVPEQRAGDEHVPDLAHVATQQGHHRAQAFEFARLRRIQVEGRLQRAGIRVLDFRKGPGGEQLGHLAQSLVRDHHLLPFIERAGLNRSDALQNGLIQNVLDDFCLVFGDGRLIHELNQPRLIGGVVENLRCHNVDLLLSRPSADLPRHLSGGEHVVCFGLAGLVIAQHLAQLSDHLRPVHQNDGFRLEFGFF